MSLIKQQTTGTIPFHFIGSLCDFLPKRIQGQFHYQLLHPTSVKDAIEAMGVPHVEVECIKVHGKDVPFTYQLKPEDAVIVYPFISHNTFSEVVLRPPLKRPIKFILDVHLGSLARLLRLAGFDTYYETEAADAIIAKIAAKEDRVVLTRDIGLLKHKIIHWGYWIRSQHREEQFKEVACRFNLWSSFSPFSYCLACNGSIKSVNKEMVMNLIPSNAALYFHSFFQCQSCQRVYWKGTHYDRMLETLERLHNKGNDC
ncbi:MAG TPA: Mut7-C RNAse domain-containing protein [Flavisolibacter sp.]|nr:Mut7-C RNAse domain-containing protein [Flavisolibacter sp.]